jgi:hypothetical protein
MDKIQPTGQNLGRVFNSRRGCVHAKRLHCFETKLPNLKLKTWPKQLLGSLLLDIALPKHAFLVAISLMPDMIHRPKNYGFYQSFNQKYILSVKQWCLLEI